MNPFLSAALEFQATQYGYRDPASLVSIDVCPHCKTETFRHAFVTSKGCPVEMYRCQTHGDVRPIRSYVANNVMFTIESA